jgi:hypothetical protein
LVFTLLGETSWEKEKGGMDKKILAGLLRYGGKVRW